MIIRNRQLSNISTFSVTVDPGINLKKCSDENFTKNNATRKQQEEDFILTVYLKVINPEDLI